MRIQRWLELLAPVGAVLVLGTTLSACPGEDEEQQEAPPQNCVATVTFEEIIVTKDTDPGQVDQWNISARVEPNVQPVPQPGAAGVPIVQNANGDWGARLMTDNPAPPPQPQPPLAPFQFGPTAVGLKGQPRTLRIIIEGEEVDPPGAGASDRFVAPQQLEVVGQPCPSAPLTPILLT